MVGSIVDYRLSGLQIIGLAYMAGITMTTGAALAGVAAIGGLFPYALQKWFGLDGEWAVLMAGVFLVYNSIYLPAGAAGHFRAKADERREQRRQGQRPPPLGMRVYSAAVGAMRRQ